MICKYIKVLHVMKNIKIIFSTRIIVHLKFIHKNIKHLDYSGLP